ncbi:MAG: hypothetical protein ACRBB6_15890 [Neptuniibacter sp.]
MKKLALAFLSKALTLSFIAFAYGCSEPQESIGLWIGDDMLLKVSFERDLKELGLVYEEDAGFFYFDPGLFEKANMVYQLLVNKNTEEIFIKSGCVSNQVSKRLPKIMPAVLVNEGEDIILKIYREDFYNSNIPKFLLEIEQDCNLTQ